MKKLNTAAPGISLISIPTARPSEKELRVPAPPTSRTGVSFHASPLLIGSAIAAFGSSILLAVLWYFDSRMPPPPIAGRPPPPPGHVTLYLVLGLCMVTWLAVLVAVCRDQVVTRINTATQEVLTAVSEFGERRETEGYLMARRAEPPRGGGEVVPFPRQP
jgi:hypothetical protein